MAITTEIPIDVGAVVQSVGAVVLGVIGWYYRENEKKKAEAIEAQQKRTDERFEGLNATLTEVVHDVRDMRATMTARFDALQSAVDGHSKEIEIGRDSRGKLHVRIDSQAERLTRAETRLEPLVGGAR
jgi:chromosome segregation ATPase